MTRRDARVLPIYSFLWPCVRPGPVQTVGEFLSRGTGRGVFHTDSTQTHRRTCGILRDAPSTRPAETPMKQGEPEKTTAENPLRHPVLRDRFLVFLCFHGDSCVSGFWTSRIVAHRSRAVCWKSVGNWTDFCRGSGVFEPVPFAAVAGVSIVPALPDWGRRSRLDRVDPRDFGTHPGFSACPRSFMPEYFQRSETKKCSLEQKPPIV